MKIFLLGLIILNSALSFAAEDLGQKVEFYSKNGNPQFGVQTAAGKVYVTFTVNGYELVQNKIVNRVAIRLLNKSSGQALTDWQSGMDFPGGINISGTQAFTMSADGASKVLRSSVIQIAITKGAEAVFSGYIDLGSYCTSASGHFVSLDTGKTGCP